MTGPVDRVLSDGDWDGWSWAPDYVGEAPDEPIPAPVPGPGAFALLGSMLLVTRRRRGPSAPLSPRERGRG